jgi:hypothetical protein
MTTTTDHLSTYLRDHRAAAEAGSDIARRLHDENCGTPYEDFLAQLAEDVEEDVMVLERIMERFDVGRPLLKTAAAKAAERLGRLKPNNELTAYSPLSRVIELESLRAGVQGKLALWEALTEIAPFEDRLDAGELAQLIGRAESQLTGLRLHHRLAAREAFATS